MNTLIHGYRCGCTCLVKHLTALMDCRCVMSVLWVAVIAIICRSWVVTVTLNLTFWQQIDSPSTSSHPSWFGYGVRCSILMTDIHVRRLNWMQWNQNWLFRCRHWNIKERERSHRVLNWQLISISTPFSIVRDYLIYDLPHPHSQALSPSPVCRLASCSVLHCFSFYMLSL